MHSILTQYHDCDRVAVVVAAITFYAILAIVVLIGEKRREFSEYEQRRLEYSKRRIEAIRRCEM